MNDRTDHPPIEGGYTGQVKAVVPVPSRGQRFLDKVAEVGELPVTVLASCDRVHVQAECLRDYYTHRLSPGTTVFEYYTPDDIVGICNRAISNSSSERTVGNLKLRIAELQLRLDRIADIATHAKST